MFVYTFKPHKQIGKSIILKSESFAQASTNKSNFAILFRTPPMPLL